MYWSITKCCSFCILIPDTLGSWNSILSQWINCSKLDCIGNGYRLLTIQCQFGQLWTMHRTMDINFLLLNENISGFKLYLTFNGSNTTSWEEHLHVNVINASQNFWHACMDIHWSVLYFETTLQTNSHHIYR